MKTVLTFLAKVHIAHQAKRDSFPVSSFPLILLILPLILIKLMNPSVEIELAYIIFCGQEHCSASVRQTDPQKILYPTSSG